ncbi:MAG TPA: nitroreductase family protein [Gaiellaceae bacterium]|nr:nitroreductase family protein [Gaiellaceae bacterium]
MSFRPIPLAYERPDPATQLTASKRFLELMRTRRSVRHFSSDPVPSQLIENAIATAGTAPSGAHQQPWTFVVVTDPELKREIRAAAEEEERTFYGRRASREWLRALEAIGTDWRKPHIEDAPYVIVVFAQTYGLEEGRKRKHYYVQESVGIAVGLLLASLHAAGLAALTHTPAPMKFLAELLGRPENERAFCLIPVGYPATGATVPDLTRKPLGEILVRA